MNYSYSSCSGIGTRKNNEDSLIVCEGRDRIAAAVADGLGGYKGGEIASALFTEQLRSDFESSEAEGTLDLCECFGKVNSSILNRQEIENSKMKTTAAAVCVTADKTVIANVGDSRVYAFKDGGIVFCTTDHSVAQMCVELGEIDTDGIRSHPDRSVLTRTLGSREDVRTDLTELDTNSFDSLLLCTDGFWNYVHESDMCRALNASDTPQQWLDEMMKRRSETVSDDNDNHTAIAIMFKE